MANTEREKFLQNLFGFFRQRANPALPQAPVTQSFDMFAGTPDIYEGDPIGRWAAKFQLGGGARENPPASNVSGDTYAWESQWTGPKSPGAQGRKKFVPPPAKENLFDFGYPELWKGPAPTTKSMPAQTATAAPTNGKMITMPDGSKRPFAGQPQQGQTPKSSAGDWVDSLMSLSGFDRGDFQKTMGMPAKQKQAVMTSDTRTRDVSPAGDPVRMAEIAAQRELGNRFLDLAGGGIRKAPDMMGTLYGRTLEQRQQQDALLASRPQAPVVPYAMPNAKELALRQQGRQGLSGDVQYQNPGVMTQAQAGTALDAYKRPQGLDWENQFRDFLGNGQRMGISPSDPAAIQSFLQKQGVLPMPTTGANMPTRRRPRSA